MAADETKTRSAKKVGSVGRAASRGRLGADVSERQLHGEESSAERARLEADLAAVFFHDLFRDGEAEPRAFTRSTRRPERFEDAIDEHRIDTWARVRDAHDVRPVLDRALDLD